MFIFLDYQQYKMPNENCADRRKENKKFESQKT